MKKTISIISVIFVAWIVLGQLLFFRNDNWKTVDNNLMVVVIDTGKGDKLESFRFEGKELYKLTRPPVVSIFNLASGSQIFVYDLSGQLLAWCSDAGDNPNFGQRWGGFFGAREISIEEVRRRNRKK